MSLPFQFFHAESPLTAAEWTIDQRVTRYEDSNQKERALETDSSTEEKVDAAEGTSTKQNSTENRRAASLVTLPPRERRLTWNRWMEWFRPLKSINRSPVHSPLRFLPVRGRKTTFIAARGKKSTLKGQSKSLVDQVKLHLASPLMDNYSLVAVVLKRLPRESF